MSTEVKVAKPKGRKRLSDEEKAARAIAAEEKRRITQEKRAAKEAAAESKRKLKAAIADLKRQQEELRQEALIEDRKQKCEMVRQYAARMQALKNKKANMMDLRQSAIFDRPVGGALRSPPGDDVIYEEEEGMARQETTESESESEDSQLEQLDWDSIQLPNAN